jgi:hypothetical protein
VNPVGAKLVDRLRNRSHEAILTAPPVPGPVEGDDASRAQHFDRSARSDLVRCINSVSGCGGFVFADESAEQIASSDSSSLNLQDQLSLKEAFRGTTEPAF